MNAQTGARGTSDWPLTGADALNRKMLKQLQRRTDAPGLFYLAVHLAALACTAALIYATLGTVFVVPAMILHGSVIVLLFAPLHECTHGTAFRTRWLNGAVAWFAAVLTMRPALYFKYRHASHHTYTQHPEMDPDIVPMPSSVGEYLRLVLGFSFWGKLVGTLYRGVTMRFNAEELRFIPEVELRRVSREMRILCAVYLAVLAASLATGSWIAVTYWLLPRFLGEPVLRAIRMAEHTATEESPDLLANTRTTLCNPVLRTLYWNMPYHAEHHLATSIPFHALPKLHGEVRDRLRHVTAGYPAVHREILSAVRAAGRAQPAHS